MKQLLLTLVCVAFAFCGNAQIKVHDDGQVSIGTLSKTGGVQIQPFGNVYFQPAINQPFASNQMSYSPNLFLKNFTVEHDGNHNFFVYGNGQVYTRGGVWIDASSASWSNVLPIKNPLQIIQQMNGVLYFQEKSGTQKKEKQQLIDELIDNDEVNASVKPVLVSECDRMRAGLSVEAVEKVFPDAVRTMPDGSKAIAYDEIVVLCLEAIKELNVKVERLEKKGKNK